MKVVEKQQRCATSKIIPNQSEKPKRSNIMKKRGKQHQCVAKRKNSTIIVEKIGETGESTVAVEKTGEIGEVDSCWAEIIYIPRGSMHVQ